MSFDTFSSTYRPIIESHLDTYLTFNIEDNRKILEEAIRYSTLNNGKRIRPLLTLATYQLFNDDITPVLPIACAIEIIHSYSLIHDDLPAMDDDDYRRGKLTCHKKYGEDIAILTGDSLNTFAFELITTELKKSVDSEIVLDIIIEFSKACGIHGMAGGQCLDLTHSNNNASEKELLNIHNRKTGTLLQSCFTLPALLHNAPQVTQKTLSEIGYHCGLLFQVVDDILDVTENKKTLGKTPQKDINQNKLTYVSLWGLQGAKEKADTLYSHITSLLDILDTTHLSALREIIDFIRYRHQ